MYTLEPATLDEDARCSIYSPACDLEFEIEVAAATLSSDRVCKAFTEITMFFEIDFITHAATEKAATAFIANIHTALQTQFPPFVDEAVFKILLFRGSVRAVLFVLNENKEVIAILKDAIHANTFMVTDKNNVNATALETPVDPIFSPPKGGTLAVGFIVSGLGVLAVAYIIWKKVTDYKMSHYTSARPGGAWPPQRRHGLRSCRRRR